jgi:tRNA uridine 5-carboxymethylaminomethyl modification enzyme
MRSEERVRIAERGLRERTYTPSIENRRLFEEAAGIELSAPTTAFKLLQRKDLSVDVLARAAPDLFESMTHEELRILENRVRYEGYIRRERERLERSKPFESRRIPPGFRYAGLPGLSTEAAEQCARRRPGTLGEAARIPGVTPAAIAIISAHVARAGASPTG